MATEFNPGGAVSLDAAVAQRLEAVPDKNTLTDEQLTALGTAVQPASITAGAIAAKEQDWRGQGSETLIAATVALQGASGGGGTTFGGLSVTDVAAGANVTFADDGDGTLTMNVSSGTANAVAKADGVLVFDAGGNNGAARPTGYGLVYWLGVTAEPTNAAPGDLWFEAV